MFSFRVLTAAVLFASLAAADSATIAESARAAEQKCALTPKGLDVQFRLLAASTLQAKSPELSRKFIDSAVDELRANPELVNIPAIKFALGQAAPDKLAAFFPPAPNVPAPVATARPTQPSEVAAIQKQIGTMRSLPTDEDRSRLVLQIVEEIRALPPAIPKLGPIGSLANVATEGDLGKPALNAVASALDLALKENSGTAQNYVELAKLVRYEHLTPLPSNPSLDAADALLELHDRAIQDSGFSLTGLDGKTYTLEGLRGKVVLLNFWATWCPPCRREMPDMDKLYRRFSSKGLVVLAVSDEKRDTVTEFLKKQNYSFPVALDAGREVNKAFGIEGIPNSFLFDRNGKLVGESIDMCTERQFLEMFKAAGLE